MYKIPYLTTLNDCFCFEALGPCFNQYVTIVCPVNITGNARDTGDTEISDLQIGVNGTNERREIIRGLVSFNISSVPQACTVVSAVLRVYQAEIDLDVYESFGVIVTDHVDFGAAITGSAYNEGTISSNIGTISNNSALGFKTLDVSASVQNDINSGRQKSQYRFRFTDETPVLVDDKAAFFEDIDNQKGSGNLPELVITYQE